MATLESPLQQPPFELKKPTRKTAHAKINANGRIVIPAEMRAEMGIGPGDSVVLKLEGGVLRIISYDENIRQIQEFFKPYGAAGVLASDELIAERRAEARKELEEALG